MQTILLIYVMPFQSFLFCFWLLFFLLSLHVFLLFFFSFRNFFTIRFMAKITEYIINIDMEARVLFKTSYSVVLYICYFYEIAYQKDNICDIYTSLTKVQVLSK